MPYARNTDLPAAVRVHLPARAQTIYRKAFNHAWWEYALPSSRRGDSSREVTAHRVAWAAVKRSFRKQGECWLRN